MYCNIDMLAAQNIIIANPIITSNSEISSIQLENLYSKIPYLGIYKT